MTFGGKYAPQYHSCASTPSERSVENGQNGSVRVGTTTSRLSMVVSLLTLLISSDCFTVHQKVLAFAPARLGRFDVSLQKSWKTKPYMGSSNDYLDDVAKKGDGDEEDKNLNNTTSIKNSGSPTNEYLDDAAYKDPQTYLDDMGSKRSDASAKARDSDDHLPSNAYLSDTPASSTQLDGAKFIFDDIDEGDEKLTETSKMDPYGAVNGDTSTISETAALTHLLQIAARTGRGELANPSDKKEAEKWINVLEANNPTPEPTKSPLINGRWELLYSSTQLFRSSPFFMAGRAVCTTDDQAQQYDWFCDMHRKALAISNIGSVRQIVSPTLLVSEFEVKVGAIPFFNFTPLTPFPYSGGLPFTIDGAIVSSADIFATNDGNAWELFMDTVQIQGSNVPGLRRVLDDGLKLDSRQLASFLEQNLDGYKTPRPVFETTFLSESLRVSRDQDGKVFVYQKVSDDTSPTDYSKVEADLGLLQFLEGLNDNIIKYYE
ncbi:plastid lipid-associated PAP/fibrillin family protein [Nitzschia inconspicua]|uniref:Plastid lipid-associated PAP/fibrillin family protein n=1 Tax=Nitzschia inconspicua TaxID=303405 RepID=A0A9K3KWL5_9STRA|nr:plastid lipid-associated PAP/fibrillin family protein [Nitzschia inconspicua]